MSTESTRIVMEQYLQSEHGDVSMMADDVVFTNMATGDRQTGREEVLGMLNYFYHVAFEAYVEMTSKIYTDRQAVFEASFIGRHIGEFAGIPPTGKEVRVPICVVYDLEDDQIKRARVYFEVPVLMAQLGAA